jgi:hypothetical protein
MAVRKECFGWRTLRGKELFVLKDPKDTDRKPGKCGGRRSTLDE